MVSTLLYPPGHALFDSSTGKALSGGKISTYKPNTTASVANEKSAYPTKADADANTNALSNPVVLDTNGRKEIWLDGAYDVVVKTAGDVIVQTIDDVGDATTSNLGTNFIGGLITSNGTDTDHDVDIAVGECRDAADSFDIVATATITVAIDGTAGANAIDTGTVAADTSYAIWVIADSSGTNSTAGIFSTSFSSPTLPTGYDKKRLIGAVLTDSSSNIIGYTQSGDYFRYTGDIPSPDVSDSTITDLTYEVGTLKVPPSCLAHVAGTLSNTSETATTARLYIRTNGAADDTAVVEEAWDNIGTAGTFDRLGSTGYVLVDSSSQIQYASTEAAGTASITVTVLGFIMTTRSEP